MKQSLEDLQHIYQILNEATPNDYIFLNQKLTHISAMISQFSVMATHLFNNETTSIDSLNYFNHGTDIIVECDLLHKLLYQQVSRYTHKKQLALDSMKYTSLLGGVIAALVLVYFTISFYRANHNSFVKLRLNNRELNNHKEQIKQIIDLIPHMIVARDLQGKILLANKTV